MDVIVWLFIWVICAFVSGSISSSKGRSYGEGFMIGLFLGFLGILIVALLPRNEKGIEQEKLQDGTGKKCPYCAEIIKREATVCRFCGRDLPVTVPDKNEVGISKDELAKLTYRQRYAVTEYGYLLSEQDAETVGQMLGSIVREKDIPPFFQANGKKVLSFEQ